MQSRLGATIAAIMLAVFLGIGSLPAATPAHADGGVQPCEPQIETELPEPNDNQALFIGSLCGEAFTGTNRLRIFSFDGSSSWARYTLLVDKSF